jgi:hypothetical protein
MIEPLTGSAGLARLKIVYETEDGQRGSIPVPVPARNAGCDPVSTLTEIQAAVLQVIDEATPGTVLTFDAIADRAGYSATQSLREYVRRLADAGRLKRIGGNRGWEVT